MIDPSPSRFGSEPEIQITMNNRERLDQLLSDHAPIRSWRAVEFLVRELMRASVVSDDEIASDVVTMGSRVTFREGHGAPDTVTLVYPGESHLYEDSLSVLTPLGAALLGLSKGQAISFPKPQGGMRTVTILEVANQPEAARRLTSSAVTRSEAGRRV
jgi:regulator of nucleoside diphosphate kinase